MTWMMESKNCYFDNQPISKAKVP